MKGNLWFKKYANVKPRILNTLEEKTEYQRRQEFANKAAEAIVQKAQISDLRRPFATI